MILKSLLLLLIVGELKITRAEEGCGPPPPVEHTIPIEQTKFPVNHSLRYKCEPGFRRKAGTSNQIKCKFNSTSLVYGWHTPLHLICVATSTKKTTTATPEYTTSTGTPLPTVGQTTTHDSSVFLPHSNQPAVVSGSVLAVVAFILLTGLLCFLRSKKALPFRQRYNMAETAAASERVAMATQPNTDSHPSSGTPLCEDVVSDSDGPPS
ncbi:interleukin-15 receptor subunit alpha-like isoform X2 [Alosa sapidissima]|uniref:interleukin-15 receptor subunit alpha-like isoform X2 n=1 Tax=Alosa sapidissima TaxID=34773 RepID=UPI001C080AC2|nr:interleukin-15 receptor subunit alpha-like isoform X2 [Alosa sapidissima]